MDSRPSLIAPLVFGRHIILWNFSCVDFSHVRLGRIFDPVDRFGLKGLPLLDQFQDALRTRLGDVRQSLSVAGLAA